MVKSIHVQNMNRKNLKKGMRMSNKYNKLKGRIVEIFGSQREFAKKLSTSEQSVTAKLNEHTQFTQKDIILWSEKLGISENQVGTYFFANKLSKR